MHPVDLFGKAFQGVGPHGPPLKEFEQESRWQWKPYRLFVSHVYKHQTRQCTPELYRSVADQLFDYDGPSWNGYSRKLENFSSAPHENYYEPQPLEMFSTPLSVSPPSPPMDPPQTLRELPAAHANDAGTYFTSSCLWAPGSLEDVSAYPHSFATCGSKGVHFFDHKHNFVSEYKPDCEISQIAASKKADCWLYLHEKEEKVSLGALDGPEEILLQFDLPQGFRPTAISYLDPLGSPSGQIGRAHV